MVKNSIYISLLVLLIASSALSQTPMPGGGRPGFPPTGSQGPGSMHPQLDEKPRGDWMRPHDKNGNGLLERDEFDAAVQVMFSELDKDQNGLIEGEELRHRGPRPGRPEGAEQPQPNLERRPLLPPFF